MSESFALWKPVASPEQAEFVDAAGLDFLSVSFQEGRLRVGGNLVPLSNSGRQATKLLIDTNSATGLIWFRNIEIPAEVLTPFDGTLFIPATTGVTLLPLRVSRGVLAALGFESGLPLCPIVSTEAVLGLLNELQLVNGVLCGRSGIPVAKRSCLGLLARVGVRTGQPLEVGECLALCQALGIQPRPAPGLAAGLRDRFIGQDKRLYRCLVTLEERGYHIRLRYRINAECRPIVFPEESTSERLLRTFNFSRNQTPIARSA